MQITASSSQPLTPLYSTTVPGIGITGTITDRSGHPIDDLTAKDFAVTEGGTPQTIRSFEYQELTAASYSQPTQLQIRSRSTTSSTALSFRPKAGKP